MAGLPQLPNACAYFKGDKYSQALRWKNGYSDCSSFVSKGMKKLGLKYPAGGTTISYLNSPQWASIPLSSVQAGDIIVNASHMIVATGPGQGMGQQNPRRNVQTGSIKDLMSGTGAYRAKRYVGSTSGIQDVGLVIPGFPDIPGTDELDMIKNIFSALGAVDDALAWLTDMGNWIRIGMVLGGAAILFFAFVGISRMQAVAQQAGKAVKNAQSGNGGTGKP